MKQLPINQFPRQSLSVVLEGALYELSLKECNGIMAVTVVRDGVTIVSNRRAVAGTPIIPAGYLEEGNFVILTRSDDLPYYTEFDGQNTFLYVTAEELDVIRTSKFVDISYGSIPSGPLVDFDYRDGELSYGLEVKRTSQATFVSGSGILNTAGKNVARFDHNPDNLKLMGLLIEDAAIQCIGSNRDFNGINWGGGSGPTVPFPGITETGPDGNLDGIKISLSNGPTDTKYCSTSGVGGAVVGNDIWFSQWIKGDAGTTMAIALYTSGGWVDKIDPESEYMDLSGAGRLGWVVHFWTMTGNWQRVYVGGRKAVSGNSVNMYPIEGRADPSSIKNTYIIALPQIEGNLLSSFIYPNGTIPTKREPDNLTVIQPGVQSVYREYIPQGTTQIIKEYVVYDGVLCPAGYLLKLKAWNRLLSQEEIKELGV